MSHPSPPGVRPPDRPGPERPAPPPRRAGRPGGPSRDRRPLDPAQVRRAARLTVRFGLLALAGVLVTALPLPWGLASLGFTVAALVVGVLALVAVVKARLRASTVVYLSVGLALVGLLLLVGLVQVAIYPVAADDQACRGAAITARALEQCDQDRQDRLFDLLLGR